MKAQIVVGLGFGDEGKGITTDFLCSKHPDSIVVRFSGGHQSGHTVIIDGQKHVHASFPSGTLRGLPGYISEHCCFYPVTLMNEYKVLRDIGIEPTLVIHPLAKMTTPYDVASNRNDVLNKHHGTCGLGISKTMKRVPKLYAIDLLGPKPLLHAKLKVIKDWYSKYEDYNIKDEYEAFVNAIETFDWNIRDYNFLTAYFQNIIFEGSQGIMLDMEHGVFPNVTYANTTSKNAHEICDKLDIIHRDMYYVTRGYLTRHGNGWMPNEKELNLKNTEHETNVNNQFQGALRYGELDYDLLNYALKVDKIYSKHHTVQSTLIVTCTDQIESEVDLRRIYVRFKDVCSFSSPDSKHFTPKVVTS